MTAATRPADPTDLPYAAAYATHYVTPPDHPRTLAPGDQHIGKDSGARTSTSRYAYRDPTAVKALRAFDRRDPRTVVEVRTVRTPPPDVPWQPVITVRHASKMSRVNVAWRALAPAGT